MPINDNYIIEVGTNVDRKPGLRTHQALNYKTAIEQNLPIGSGEVESAHRYVIQKRLKIAGAWWEKENARDMLALRILRANNKWDDYWSRRAA
jgi:hypothetical protein